MARRQHSSISLLVKCVALYVVFVTMLSLTVVLNLRTYRLYRINNDASSGNVATPYMPVVKAQHGSNRTTVVVVAAAAQKGKATTTTTADDDDLSLFLRQNTSFFDNLPCIYNWTSRTQRLYAHSRLTECNDDWAYIHIFKAGGTTVQLQCNMTSVGNYENPIYLTRSLFTFVRDPIDHFISGFTECASRRQPHGLVPTNDSIMEYLVQLTNRRRPGYVCSVHSAPQIEFLLYNTGFRPEKNLRVEAVNNRTDRFLRRIKFVGDMKDMKHFFQKQGLPWNDSLVELRHYNGRHQNDEQQQRHHSSVDMLTKEFAQMKPKTNDFMSLRQRLSPHVIDAICNFVRIDYCFFNYTPPTICRQSVVNFCQQTCSP